MIYLNYSSVEPILFLFKNTITCACIVSNYHMLSQIEHPTFLLVTLADFACSLFVPPPTMLATLSKCH